MCRIDELLSDAQAQLSNSDSARLDAEVLLALALHKQRSYLHAFPEIKPDTKTIQEYSRLLARRAAGEPVAHLTGQREFWSLNLKVSPDTLIPRPDTELLVETSLALIPGKNTEPVKLADLGTGSGAIAIALASECPQCVITATDLSTAALAVAKENARQHQCDNINFIHSNWCSAFAEHEQFDIIISNPPYIRLDDPHMKSAELAYEPEFALTSGEDGLDALRCIIPQACLFLVDDGWLLVEHGYDQAGAVRDLFNQHGYRDIETRQDLAGHSRITMGRKG